MVMVNVVRNPKVARWVAMAVLTAAAFGASAGLQQAAETAPPLPEKKLTFRDIQLSVHARKALADDPILGPLNLGVRVQDNTAILWGPAPSEALKRRAVDVVKKVKGVFSVKDADVYIAAPTVAVETAEATPLRTSGGADAHRSGLAAGIRRRLDRPAGRGSSAAGGGFTGAPSARRRGTGPNGFGRAAGRPGRRRRAGATGRRPLPADRLPAGRRRGHSPARFRARRGRDGVRAGDFSLARPDAHCHRERRRRAAVTRYNDPKRRRVPCFRGSFPHLKTIRTTAKACLTVTRSG